MRMGLQHIDVDALYLGVTFCDVCVDGPHIETKSAQFSLVRSAMMAA